MVQQILGYLDVHGKNFAIRWDQQNSGQIFWNVSVSVRCDRRKYHLGGIKTLSFSTAHYCTFKPVRYEAKCLYGWPRSERKKQFWLFKTSQVSSVWFSQLGPLVLNQIERTGPQSEGPVGLQSVEKTVYERARPSLSCRQEGRLGANNTNQVLTW